MNLAQALVKEMVHNFRRNFYIVCVPLAPPGDQVMLLIDSSATGKDVLKVTFRLESDSLSNTLHIVPTFLTSNLDIHKVNSIIYLYDRFSVMRT